MKKTILALMLFVLSFSCIMAESINFSDSNYGADNAPTVSTITTAGIPAGSEITDIQVTTSFGSVGYIGDWYDIHLNINGTDYPSVGWLSAESYTDLNNLGPNDLTITATTEDLDDYADSSTLVLSVDVFYNPPAGTPDEPTLVSPANGATNVAIDTNLEWTTGENTDHTVLYLADNAEFTGATVVNPATSPYTTSLNYSTTYFCKVEAIGPTDVSVMSEMRTFSTEIDPNTPDMPELTLPSNGALNVAIDTNLEWTNGDNTDHAVLYLADNAEFTGATVVNPATSPYTTSLNNGTSYFWKVVAVGPTAIEVESNVNNFTTPFEAITEFPYEQGFEMWPPAGWVLNPESGTGAWLQNNGTSYGPGSANIYAGTYAAMFNNYSYSNGTIGSMETPELDLSGMTAPLVKFYWWNNDGSSSPAHLKVYTKESEGEWLLVEDIEVYGSGVTSWVESSNLIPTDVRFVKLEAVSDYGMKNTYVDGFRIEEAPLSPIVEINTDPIAFGTVSLNEASDSEIVSIKNIGGGTLNITNIDIIGTDADQFSKTDSEDYALTATEELLIEVIFNPTSAGEKTATLQITDDLTREVYEIALSGTGIDTNIYEINIPYTQGFETEEGFLGWTSNINSTSSYATSDRYNGSANSGTYSYKVYNSDDTSATAELISPVVVPDMDAYRVRFWARKSSTSNTQPLIVGKYNQAMDSFTAIDTLDMTTTYAEYTVNMATPVRANERIAFQFSFTGTYQYIYIDDLTFEEAPEGALVEITPDAHDFGEIFIASETSQTFTVANNGVLAADITEITVPTGYSHETEVSFPYTLEAGASFTVDVTFAPQAEMIYSGNLRVKEADPANPFGGFNHDVSLTGTGIPVPQGDNHNNPFIITLADSVTVTGTTTPFQTYYSFCSSQSVVYQLTLPTDKLMTVSLDGTAWDTKLWIFNSFQQIDDATSATTADAWYYNDDEGSATTGGDRAKSRDRATWSEMLETYTPEGVYYILVSGYNANNGEYTLTVETADIPLPTAVTTPNPANEAIDQPTSLTLSWTNPEYTDNIDLYFGTPDNMTLVLDNVIAVEEHQVTDLDPSTVYNWKVIARNISGDTPEVDVLTWSFTTIGNAPEATTYTTPADEATDRPIAGNLTWSAATGANGYFVYLSTDETFADVTPQDQAATTYAYSGLAYETTYYWKVIPYNVVGQATEGIEVWSFTTIPDPSLELPVIVTFDASTSMPAEIIANNMGISASHGNNSNGLYKNIYGSYPDAYAQFQVMRNVEADTELNFEYRLMAFSGYPGAAQTIIEGEYIRVKVSTDGGANYDTAYEINSANHVVSTDFANVSVPLGAYAGQYITVRLEAHRADGDYFVDFDNFYFRVPPTTPLVDLSTEEIDFGQIVLGDTSDAETVTITNIGGGTLNISGIAINGTNAGDFAYSTADGASMALGFNESLTIDVTTTPSISGALVASLDITDDMNRNVTSIALTALGYDATITGPFFNGLENETDVFGWNVNLESTSDYATAGRYSSSSSAHSGTYSFRVYCPNYASTSAELISPVITPDLNDYRVKFYAKGVGTIVVGKYNQEMDSFTAIDTISTLAEYSYNEYTVELTAARTNERIAFQFATSSTTYSSKYIYLDDLTFEEIPSSPIAQLSASEIDFASVLVNETSSEDVTITNVGVGELIVSNVEITGVDAAMFDFDELTLPATLLANEMLDINVTFSPTSEGEKTATLTITDNTDASPYTVTLTGTALFNDNNNTPETATELTLDVAGEEFAIDIEDDIDWYKFYCVAGTELNMYSERETSGIDTKAWFYGPKLEDGSDIVPTSYNTYNDDGHGDVQFEINTTVTEDGWYYLRVAYYGDGPTSERLTQKLAGSRATTGIYWLHIYQTLPRPEVPVNFTIANDGSSITLTWEAATNATSYNVYACDTPDGDYVFVENVEGLTTTITASDTMKFYRVKGSNSGAPEVAAKGFRRQ